MSDTKINEELKTENDRLRKLVQQLTDTIAAKNEELNAKDIALREKDKALTAKDSDLKEKNKALNDKDATLREKEDALNAKDITLREKEEALQLKGNALKKAENEIELLNQEVKKHRIGISAEPTGQESKQEMKFAKHPKDSSTKEFIIKSINANAFLKNLEKVQINEIVDCMYQREFAAEQYICREGGVGTELYVLAEGEVQVTKGGAVKQIMKQPGKVFGELAILYNCPRTATLKALTPVKVWTLDRSAYQSIMKYTGIKLQSEKIRLLKSVPAFKELFDRDLVKIADVLTEDYYSDGQYIIRQGAVGDTFFIISEGTVKVTRIESSGDSEVTIRTQSKGEFFGERALQGDNIRTANVIAVGDVCCFTLDKDHFMQHINVILPRPCPASPPMIYKQRDKKEYTNVTMSDLEHIATLGIGGFGRVELVQLKGDRTKTFALKCLKKKHIVETHQQQHIFSEKEIMLQGDNPFIAKLYTTFRCTKYLYMLLEACLGGEVWTVLRNRKQFNENTARFCTACVVEAFEYLHIREIIYRDLKPENLLIDGTGYLKLVDFGFAKHISNSRKAWTFCGTPEYVAPEIILNKGHDIAADYWSLGILIYELLNGVPPFSGSDAMSTYSLILQGIDSIKFPKKIGRTAEILIKKLCRDNPAERIGYLREGLNGIKSHRWFETFDWKGLVSRTLQSPLTPEISGPTDTSYFDRYDPDCTPPPPDDTTGWDMNFGQLQPTPLWIIG